MAAEKDKEKKKNSDKKNDDSESEIKKLKKEIKQLQQELKDKNDKLLRSYADFQNYQKRMEKEICSKENEVKRRYISELIDLKDLLKKAYEDDNPKEGLKLLLSNFESFFEKEQIRYIDCMGKNFDHNLHHAVSTVEKDDCEDNTIVEEVKKGYLIDDKVLRPSQVIVAKNKKK